MDVDGDGSVTVDEIISAVSNALPGCGAAAPTPTATSTPRVQGTPTHTPIPVPGCDNGVVRATFSSPSNTNADTSPAELTRVAASQVRDPASGAYLWQIVGNMCLPAPGLVRSVQVQLIGVRSAFAPGSYPLIPPLGNLMYLETPPLSIQPRIWQSTGATLVIEAVSGGTLSFRIDGAPMTPNTIVSGNPKPEGTFNLSVTGTVRNVTGP